MAGSGSKQVICRVPAELHRRVKLKAAREDVTISQVLRWMLREWIDEEMELELAEEQ